MLAMISCSLPVAAFFLIFKVYDRIAEKTGRYKIEADNEGDDYIIALAPVVSLILIFWPWLAYSQDWPLAMTLYWSIALSIVLVVEAVVLLVSGAAVYYLFLPGADEQDAGW